MLKANTSSYILELELKITNQEQKTLAVKFKVAKQVYNACLNYASKRLKSLKSDKEYRFLIKQPSSKERNNRLRKIEQEYGYSEYQLHKVVSDYQKHFKKHIGSMEAQKLATRAFQAIEKVHYKKAKRVFFKRNFDLMSVENKSNISGLRKKDLQIIWGDLKLDLIIKNNDYYALEGLTHRTKYVRIIQKEIRGKTRYYAQLVQEGIPPRKYNQKHSTDPSKVVGLDLGVSTVAIVGEDKVKLAELAPNCTSEERKLRLLQRAMERSKRITNPQNFNSNGTIKKGRLKWNYSNRYQKLRSKRKEIYRKLTAKRKQDHETIANDILSLGLTIRVETMSIQGLQKRAKNTTINRKNGKFNKKKRFGKTISNRAPSMLISIIDRKLKYYGHSIEKIHTLKVKASQFNHMENNYLKKTLDVRWNENIGEFRIQRDLYSAFLIKNTTEDLTSVDLDKCNASWNNFVELHDLEVKRVINSGSKLLSWYVS